MINTTINKTIHAFLLVSRLVGDLYEGWMDFITTHGLVLTYIAKHPQSAAREIASAIKVTEWTVHRTITDLEGGGYIKRQKVGRGNVYSINPHLSLRHETVSNVAVGDLLEVLGWMR